MRSRLRRFEIVSPTHHGLDARKFWEIGLDESVVRVLFGSARKGSEREFVRQFGSAEEAERYTAQEIATKLEKGWSETEPARLPTDAPVPAPDFSPSELEHAMVSRATWVRADFEAGIAEQGASDELTAVVFGVREGRAWTRTFRVDAPGKLVGANGDVVLAAPDVAIGVVHRLDLTEPELRDWRESLREIAGRQPFPQLERETRALRPIEHEARYLYRWMSAKIPRGALGSLQKRGWVKEDEGSARYKRIDAKRWFRLAIDQHEVRDVQVFDGRRYLAVEFGSLDPVAVSEMIIDIESVGIQPTWPTSS